MTNEMNTVPKEEKEMTFSVAAYALEGTPMIYVGELSDDTDVVGDDRLIFKKLMVQIHRMPQKSGIGDTSAKPMIAWGPAIAAGKDSVTILDRKAQPGTLVLVPDSSLVDEYRREVAKHYSGIHLL